MSGHLIFLSCSMIRADFEIVFSLLILGYYVYTFIVRNKEKKNAPEPQAETTAPGKKKKSFLEEFLEELEKQQNANQPKPELPVPEPMVQKMNPQKPAKPKKSVPPKMEPVSAWPSPEMEGGLTTMPSTIAEEGKSVSQKRKHVNKIVIGNTVLSPKDAVLAQVLFDRKF